MERMEQVEFSEQMEQTERVESMERTEYGTERNNTFAIEKRKKNMNAKQLNQKYQITDFLLLKGFVATHTKEANYWYKSMIRVEESTPSFKVDAKLNLWYDHGIGIGGNLIDLACYLFKTNDIRQVIREVLETFSSFQPQNITVNKTKKEGINISQIEELNEENLINYLKKRGIEKEISQKYCLQINYQNTGRFYKSIGFKNNAGGYELRGEGFKSCIAPKDISFIDNGFLKLSIFEGFMDFLSYLMLPEFEIKDCNYLILNSLSLINRIDEIINQHTRIYFFLDNDAAGQNAINKLKKEFLNSIDMTIFYKDHKDLNDYLLSK
jgi:5S rRNA maturation endonuclease (ribonuclease M5)